MLTEKYNKIGRYVLEQRKFGTHQKTYDACLKNPNNLDQIAHYREMLSECLSKKKQN